MHYVSVFFNAIHTSPFLWYFLILPFLMHASSPSHCLSVGWGDEAEGVWPAGHAHMHTQHTNTVTHAHTHAHMHPHLQFLSTSLQLPKDWRLQAGECRNALLSLSAHQCGQRQQIQNTHSVLALFMMPLVGWKDWTCVMLWTAYLNLYPCCLANVVITWDAIVVHVTWLGDIPWPFCCRLKDIKWSVCAGLWKSSTQFMSACVVDCQWRKRSIEAVYAHTHESQAMLE